jgi:predicted alpha-1,6-mannanase (GH76 family)
MLDHLSTKRSVQPLHCFQEYVGTLRWNASTTFVQLPSGGPIGVLEGWKEYLSTRLRGSDMVKDDTINIPSPTLIDGVRLRTYPVP